MIFRMLFGQSVIQIEFTGHSKVIGITTNWCSKTEIHTVQCSLCPKVNNIPALHNTSEQRRLGKSLPGCIFVLTLAVSVGFMELSDLICTSGPNSREEEE
jgi:hypothetical protein